MATIDAYAVLHAFRVTAQTIGHAIKKLLAPGQRSGGKSLRQDVEEAVWSLNRHLELMDAEEKAKGT